MKKITGEKLVEMWMHPERYGLISTLYQDCFVLNFKGYEVVGDVIVDSNIHLNAVLFDSCSFEKAISIRCRAESKPYLGAVFCKMSKLGALEIENYVVNKVVFTDNSSAVWVSLQNCEVSALINFTRQSQSSKISIGNSFIPYFRIDTDSEIVSLFISTSEIGELQATDARIGFLQINNEAKVGRLSLSRGGRINQGILIANKSRVSSFSIFNCILDGGVEWSKDSLVERLEINDSQCGYILLDKSTAVNMQINSSRLGIINVQYSTIEGITIKDGSVIMSVNFHYLSGGRVVNIRDSTVIELTLRLDKALAMTISKSKLHVVKLVSNILAKDTLILISDTGVAEFEIQSMINMGVVSFNNVYPLQDTQKFKLVDKILAVDADGKYIIEECKIEKTKFSIINSDLGKTTFINCDLNAFDQFVFLNTKMLETFVADTILPHVGKISSLEKKNAGVALLEQQRLALGQFKKVYENRGDVVKALEYHAQEMEVYRESLKGVSLKWHKALFDIGGERINLWVNRWSSYYGTNWVRAAGMTIVTGWSLFAFYCCVLGFRPGPDVGRFWELFSYSFEFINPLRKADFLEHAFLDSHKEPLYPVTPGARVVDYVARIIMAYMVYQTIQAFRKFGKKAV